ncbi:YggT family protein [Oceanobacillus alkalisoli]|uniref:YggT family protein n=1 Tax=Oceanobacillus alkalisoli TaxID=2925113 RepID=UPI001EF08D98|nr:YggT family protein [Oceanobacillus alkalisoli]MCF3942506.1 YggT family protein [Oceanobacillus alkalisoli]MCG5103563.1 YggT family protein [Oceanobacillus alkalisoli]
MEQLLGLFSFAIYIYSWVLIIYILMSWFPGARESSFGELIGRIAEPYLEIFRRFIPPLGMIDISPIVAIIVLRFAGMGLDTFFRMFF